MAKKAPKKTATQNAKARFRDRIVGLRRVPGKELRRNAQNFRKHGDRQRSALESLLDEIGFAGAVLAFKNEQGELELIDGHLRADLADDEEIPVLETDLTPDEAKKLLASFDLLGSMADIDAVELEQLLEGIEFDSREIEAALDELIKSHLPRTAEDSLAEGARKSSTDEQKLELFPNEQYDYVLVLSRTRSDWNEICKLLGIQMVRVPRSRRVGLGRCVDARTLLNAVRAQGDKG